MELAAAGSLRKFLFVHRSVHDIFTEKRYRVEGKVTGPQVPMFIVGYDTYHSVGVWPRGRKKRNVEEVGEERARERPVSAWAPHEHVSRHFS